MFENQYLTAARWEQLTICAKKTSVILADAPKWNNSFWHGRLLLESKSSLKWLHIIFYKIWTFQNRKPFKSIILEWNFYRKRSELMAGLIEIVSFIDLDSTLAWNCSQIWVRFWTKENDKCLSHRMLRMTSAVVTCHNWHRNGWQCHN